MKTLATVQLRYLRIVAGQFINGPDYDDDGECPFSDESRDAVWDGMSQTERDEVNAIVEGVFGEWL